MKKLFFALVLGLAMFTVSVKAQNGHFETVKFDTQDLIYKESCEQWLPYMTASVDTGSEFALLRTADKEIAIFTDEPTEWIWLNYYGAPYHVKKINQHEFRVKSNGFPAYWNDTDILEVVFKKYSNL